MREILFRGKRLEIGDWVEGFYVALRMVHYDRTEHLITDKNTGISYEVDPATVEQFTGVKDMDGKRVFEGDIVEFYFYDRDVRDGKLVKVKCTETVRIEWGKSTFDMVELFRDYRLGDEMEIISEKIFRYRGKRRTGVYESNRHYFIKVIGNIHDNQELLEAV